MDSELTLPADVRLLSVVITDDEVITDLNRVWREKDKSTDVLSFALWEQDNPSGMLGEVYINLLQAERQCADYGNNVQDELIRLLIHGILHLCGFDHEEGVPDELRKAMEYYEDKLSELCASLIKED